MTILLMLIPISLVLLGLAVAAFIWAVRRGQFDDLDTPALDILDDEDARKPAHPSKTATSEGDDAASPTDAAGNTGKGDAG
ncbi:cbb3-type cytochrome oxidase assembly protein CcoS [Pseudoxanthomonas sp. z9]|uniref:cbb3-type cytochrome oxidase assembly protein CcoS n=1 Tax=Pseudoxanthomonas sp. z9 TaxID=2584942 RepID=UPI0011438F0A|nr:cbb3-type cytochrome oxidase assembly protein CcoS [Pseudoxanthomonas sp. z9]MCL6713390.1 cbb3-type cytochrome oxidase assembly protein CcoS [Pseudomonas sp. R2.Fl]